MEDESDGLGQRHTPMRPWIGDLGMESSKTSPRGHHSLLHFVRSGAHQSSRNTDDAASQSSERKAHRNPQPLREDREFGFSLLGTTEDTKSKPRKPDVIEKTTTSCVSSSTRRGLTPRKDETESHEVHSDIELDNEGNVPHVDLTMDDELAGNLLADQVEAALKEAALKEATSEARGSLTPTSRFRSPVTSRTPPSAPTSPGPWWKTLLAKSGWGTSKESSWAMSPRANFFFKKAKQERAEKEKEEIQGKSERGRSSKSGRKELPRTANHNKNVKKKKKRPSLKNAMKLIKNNKRKKEAIANLEEDFFANSSRASKYSKRKTVETVLKAVTKGSAFPLTVNSIRSLSSILKETGYKSASAYIAEAKIAHIENGHDWTPLLERNIRLCKSAADRGKGPRKKAPEVQEDAWALHDLVPNEQSPSTTVCWATHLFAMAVHWMMRELEVASLTTNSIQFSTNDRSVMVSWEASKNDVTATGTKRVLKCVCDDNCDLRCPYEVLLFLVTKAKERSSKETFLAVDTVGNPATKAQVVGSWQYLYGPKVTGHSARRSGALQYIRKGWSVAQVAFLGRWKSNVILEYAQEALQTMAVNVGSKFGMSETESKLKGELDSLKVLQASVPSNFDLQQRIAEDLKKDLKQLKSSRFHDKSLMKKAIKELESKMANNQKYLPQYVVSRKVQVVHYNSRALIVSPACMWKTLCGWQYYHSNYVFADEVGTMAVCQKCASFAQGKEVSGAKLHH